MAEITIEKARQYYRERNVAMIRGQFMRACQMLHECYQDHVSAIVITFADIGVTKTNFASDVMTYIFPVPSRMKQFRDTLKMMHKIPQPWYKVLTEDWTVDNDSVPVSASVPVLSATSATISSGSVANIQSLGDAFGRTITDPVLRFEFYSLMTRVMNNS